MRRIVLALISAAVMSGAASAADMPVKAQRQHVMAPAFSWTGFYVGANVGYGFGDTTGTLAVPPGNFSIDGALAGGQIGYNYQISNWVLGIEADYQWADIKGNGATLAGVTGGAKLKSFGTVRGRIGYAWDRWMLYGTGGWAFSGRFEASSSGALNIAETQSLSGWTAGVGIEYAFAPAWSAKLEYLHINLDERTYFAGFGCAPATACQAGANIDLIRLGVNYRFGAM